jgi:hypothetical protein
MLVIGRHAGQWISVVCSASGRSMLVGVDRIYRDRNGQPTVNLTFDDPPHHFTIDRPGRRPRAEGRPADGHGVESPAPMCG